MEHRLKGWLILIPWLGINIIVAKHKLISDKDIKETLIDDENKISPYYEISDYNSTAQIYDLWA